MRLLFVSPHYGTIGGVRLIIDALAHGAIAAGHEVAAVVDADSFAFPGPAREVDCYPFPPVTHDVRRLPRFARKFPLAMTRLFGAVRAFAPDVVSLHCVRRFAPFAATLRRLGRVPQVLSLQEAALPPEMPQQRGLFRMLARSTDAIAACSAEAAAYATRVGGAGRVVVVPNGYHPGEFASATPLRHPRPYVLGIGRLEEQKGFDVLLEAFARLPHRDLDLLLAGEGTARVGLEEVARERGIAGRVHLLGATDRPTTVGLLLGAAVVACPSRFEGLPLVCVEALAARRPVVASAVNGIPEVIQDGETGLLVPPGNPAALADALTRLLDTPAEAARFAAQGLASVERTRPWSVVTRNYLRLCEEIANGVARKAA